MAGAINTALSQGDQEGPFSALANQFTGTSDDYDYGSLLPVAHNRNTGNYSLALPQGIFDTLEAFKRGAAQGTDADPMDALSVAMSAMPGSVGAPRGALGAGPAGLLAKKTAKWDSVPNDTIVAHDAIGDVPKSSFMPGGGYYGMDLGDTTVVPHPSITHDDLHLLNDKHYHVQVPYSGDDHIPYDSELGHQPGDINMADEVTKDEYTPRVSDLRALHPKLRDMLLDLKQNEAGDLMDNSPSMGAEAYEQVRRDVASGMSPAYAVARARGLDLSPGGIETRALQQGFTTPAYHGSIKYPKDLTNGLGDMEDFGAINPGNPQRIATAIGSHYAPDPEVSNTFANNTGEPSRLLPVRLRGGMHDVAQPVLLRADDVIGQDINHPANIHSEEPWPYRANGPLFDDHAVALDAAHKYLEGRPSRVAQWLHDYYGGGMPDSLHGDPTTVPFLADRLAAGKQVVMPEFTGNNMPIDLYWMLHNAYPDTINGHELSHGALINNYQNWLKQRGTPIVRYQNTAEAETHAAQDPTSLIQTDPTGIRSRFAVYNPDWSHKTGLLYAEGGKVSNEYDVQGLVQNLPDTVDNNLLNRILIAPTIADSDLIGDWMDRLERINRAVTPHASESGQTTNMPILRRMISGDMGIDPNMDLDAQYQQRMEEVNREFPAHPMAEGGAVSDKVEQSPRAAHEAVLSLRDMGRGHDSLLAHITPGEAELLHKLGGSGTINPRTGALEFDPMGDGNDGNGDGVGSGGATGGGNAIGSAGQFGEEGGLTAAGTTASAPGELIGNQSSTAADAMNEGLASSQMSNAGGLEGLLGSALSSMGFNFGTSPTGTPNMGFDPGALLGTMANVGMAMTPLGPINSILSAIGLPNAKSVVSGMVNGANLTGMLSNQVGDVFGKLGSGTPTIGADVGDTGGRPGIDHNIDNQNTNPVFAQPGMPPNGAINQLVKNPNSYNTAFAKYSRTQNPVDLNNYGYKPEQSFFTYG